MSDDDILRLAYEIFSADPTFTTPEELAAIIKRYLIQEELIKP